MDLVVLCMDLCFVSCMDLVVFLIYSQFYVVDSVIYLIASYNFFVNRSSCHIANQ